MSKMTLYKEEKPSQNLAKSASALVLSVLLLGYAVGNFFFQLPYFAFAADSGWNFTSRQQRIGDVANGHVLGQEWFLDTYAKGQNLLGKQANGGFELVRGNGGELNYINFFPYETHPYQTYGEQIYKLAEVVADQGGHFMFLSTTNLRYDDYGALPAAELGARTNALNYYLSGYGIPHVDSRQILQHAGLSETSYRYQTDFHWTVEASFEVFRGVVQQMDQSFEVVLDPSGFYRNIDNYKELEYLQSFAGELGRQAGIPFAGQEDFTLYVPSFETDFTLTITHHAQEATARGNFEDVLLASEFLAAENPYERNMVNAYLGGQAPKRIITNHLNPDGPKLLLIGDGYAAPLAAFLAPAASELHFLWPYDNAVVSNLENYIEENGFDIVLMELSPGNIGQTGFALLAE